MDTIQPTCPSCQSTNLGALDRVEAIARIEHFVRDADGKLTPEWGSSEVLWDTSTPRNPAKPYWCRDCETSLALDDLVMPAVEQAR